MSARRPSSLSWSKPSEARRRALSADPVRDRAIQTAVLSVLADVGYAGLTMDAVAATAGVSKATIYRRWESKADLLVSVIERASDETLAVPDTGSLRDDLIALLTALTKVLAGPGGGASRSLLGALTDEPALANAFRQGPMARWAEAFLTVLERGVDRREIQWDARASLAAEAGPAILLLRWMISGRAMDEDFADGLVDEVVMPLFRSRR